MYRFQNPRHLQTMWGLKKWWVNCLKYTVLGLCNRHQPWWRHEIKVSHLSYLLNKLHFWNMKTLCYINFENDITVVPLFFRKTICSRDMRDVTLWFYVLCLADDLIECGQKFHENHHERIKSIVLWKPSFGQFVLCQWKEK